MRSIADEAVERYGFQEPRVTGHASKRCSCTLCTCRFQSCVEQAPSIVVKPLWLHRTPLAPPWPPSCCSSASTEVRELLGSGPLASAWSLEIGPWATPHSGAPCCATPRCHCMGPSRTMGERHQQPPPVVQLPPQHLAAAAAAAALARAALVRIIRDAATRAASLPGTIIITHLHRRTASGIWGAVYADCLPPLAA